MKDWKTVNKGNYLYALVPDHPNSTKNGYVLEHRIVMERYLGRYLTPNEVVHHINHNTHDNRLENLRLMSKEDHGHFHKRPLRLDQHVCPVCGIQFLRRPKGIYDLRRVHCCSRSCNGKRCRQIQLNNL